MIIYSRAFFTSYSALTAGNSVTTPVEGPGESSDLPISYQS